MYKINIITIYILINLNIMTNDLACIKSRNVLILWKIFFGKSLNLCMLPTC